MTFISGQSVNNNSVRCTELNNILDDEILEGDEYFSIELTNQSAGILFTPDRDVATVTIREDSEDRMFLYTLLQSILHNTVFFTLKRCT